MSHTVVSALLSKRDQCRRSRADNLEVLTRSVTLVCVSGRGLWKCSLLFLWLSLTLLCVGKKEKILNCTHTTQLSRCFTFCPANSVALIQQIPCSYHFTSLLTSHCALCLTNKTNKLKIWVTREAMGCFMTTINEETLR